MIGLLQSAARRMRRVKATIDIPPKESDGELAKAEFATRLARVLDRPEKSHFACGCCGHSNELQATEKLNSNCLFSGLELRRFRCGHCDAIFGPISLIECTPTELGELYALLYRFYSEGFSEPFQEKTFYLLNPSRRGRYLNYACGDWAKGVKHLRSNGWDVIGLEPFQRVASDSILSRQELIKGDAFDGLMTHNFIEHVQDPAGFFIECSSLIRDGGKIAHSSPCFDYVFEVSPFHLYFYPGRSVAELAARTGFRQIAEYRVDQDFPGHQYVCCLFEKGG